MSESTKLNKYSFVDTKSPSLIHLHHPPYPHQRRQIKLSLDDDAIMRLSPPPPPPRDIIDTDFNTNTAVRSGIIENDSNRIFIDRSSLIGESHAGCSVDVLSAPHVCHVVLLSKIDGWTGRKLNWTARLSRRRCEVRTFLQILWYRRWSAGDFAVHRWMLRKFSLAICVVGCMKVDPEFESDVQDEIELIFNEWVKLNILPFSYRSLHEWHKNEFCSVLLVSSWWKFMKFDIGADWLTSPCSTSSSS